MSFIGLVLAQECEGIDSALYDVISGLLNDAGHDRKITFGQAIGIARAVRHVLAHGDEHDVQIGIGQVYLRELMPLVERTGKAQATHLEDSPV